MLFLCEPSALFLARDNPHDPRDRQDAKEKQEKEEKKEINDGDLVVLSSFPFFLFLFLASFASWRFILFVRFLGDAIVLARKKVQRVMELAANK